MSYTNFENEIDTENLKAERVWFKIVIAGVVLLILSAVVTFILSQGKTTTEDCLDAGFIPPRNSQQIQR